MYNIKILLGGWNVIHLKCYYPEDEFLNARLPHLRVTSIFSISPSIFFSLDDRSQILSLINFSINKHFQLDGVCIFVSQ